ncbi:DUF1566 domain-containing protein, partial [Chromatium okenii]|uniref:Lcl domain-containing protein n=1 Tax=Chromatium okenii TaxID=61644 RepID=UPI0026F224EB
MAANSTIALASQITIDKSLTIDGSDAQGLIISGDTDSNGVGNVRVFYINAGIAVTINNLTIANGSAEYGAGIYNAGTLNVTGCTIQDSASTHSSHGGGGIKNTGTLNVFNSTFSKNSAMGIGGAIFNDGSATALAPAVVKLESSTFDQNTASNKGGGIYNHSNSDLTVTNSTFSKNRANNYYGGGIFNAGVSGSLTAGDLSIIHSTFSENYAYSQGGGIYNDGNLQIANSIISANSINSGYGPEIFNGTYNGGYTFSPSGNNVFGFNNGLGITENTTTISLTGCHCVVPSTNVIGNIIGALTNNGGPTQTRAPVFGGLAHNAGVNSAVPTDLDYDQRGLSRIVADVDIGAVEINVMPLNDTGITSCSDATQNGLDCADTATDFPSQDAEYGRNGFDFTAIDTNGNTTTPTSGANPHPCVRDNVTGLMWEVKTTDEGLRDENRTYTFDEAASYVNAVNDLNLCGFSDWRIPTVKELYGITHLGIFNSTIDSTYFPNTPNWWFWSGSPIANYASYAWYVDFDSGYADGSNRNDYFSVRLVRGGQSFDSFVDNADDTVTQSNTGLMWAKCSEGQTGVGCTGTATTMTWSEALTAANSSSLGGYNDWRLPNAKELQALVDYSRDNPTISSSYFPNAVSSWFWSGSPDANDLDYAWFVDFGYGYASKDLRDFNGSVRLVRGGQSFDSFALTVNKIGTGSGTVISNGNFIDCGVICSYPFFNTTRVTLTATPNTGSTFTGWSGGGCSDTGTCTVTMSDAKIVTANFTIKYTLSISKVGYGSVFTDDRLISCGATCSHNFNSGTSVTLKTSPDAGYVFSNWNLCTGSGDCVVAMDANKVVIATFTESYSITATANPIAGGSISCSPNPIISGNTANCTATTNTGYT